MRLVQEAPRDRRSGLGWSSLHLVEDLAALLKALREEGCNVLEKTDDSEYGKFGWVMDPEDNKVELWQPPQGQ
jgi:predicted enzyme related to lactoylglutathione lyase